MQIVINIDTFDNTDMQDLALRVKDGILSFYTALRKDFDGIPPTMSAYYDNMPNPASPEKV